MTNPPILRAGYNRVMIAIEQQMQDWATDKEGNALLGPDGNKLYLDVLHNPIFHRYTQGIVVALPLGFDKGLTIHARNGNTPVTPEDIVDLDLLVGDTVWVDRYAVNEKDEMDAAGYPGIYHVTVDMLIARKRPGSDELVTLCGWLLLEPYYAPGIEDVPMPDGTTVKGRVGALGLLESVNEPPIPQHGRVVALGKPLRYQQDDIAVGDVVIWHKVHTVPVKVDGKELLAARREYVTCKVVEVTEAAQ